MVNGGLREFVVDPAPEDTFDAALAATTYPILAMDLRAADADSWLRQPHLTRNIGAGYADMYPSYYFTNLIAPATFDAVLFVENTTRARPVTP